MNLPSRPFLLLFACLFTFFSAAQAQTGTIQGTVTDGKAPLAGATVQIERTNKGGYTNASCSYELSIIPGEYTVQVSFVGFASQRKPVTVIAGQTVQLDFSMVTSTTMNELVRSEERRVG